MKSSLFILVLLVCVQLHAQRVKERSVDFSVGYAGSETGDLLFGVSGTGFYLQGEYVLKFYDWLDLRSYLGYINTRTREDAYTRESGFKVNSSALLLGGKVRITAPIPWAAPFVEGGVGFSGGSFETKNLEAEIEKSGVIFHYLISLGLALGPEGNFTVVATGFGHDSVEQAAWAVLFGVSFPMD